MHYSRTQVDLRRVCTIHRDHADASSESDCSHDQKQPRRDGYGPHGSSDALTGRRQALDGDSCCHDSQRAKVHHPDDQEECHQTETALAALET